MVDVILYSPSEVALLLAKAAQQKRLSLNITQKTLSQRAGVSLGTLKKFESSGKISLESLLKIALILDALKEFFSVFRLKAPEEFRTLDELLKQKTRKRGRK